jgi:hypothetical protein
MPKLVIEHQIEGAANTPSPATPCADPVGHAARPGRRSSTSTTAVRPGESFSSRVYVYAI